VAKHKKKKTAKYQVSEKPAYYFFTVKGNQLNEKAEIELLNLTQLPPDYETVDKGHGLVPTRRIWTSTALNHYLDFPNKGPVCGIQRQVFDGNQKTCRCETV